MKILSAAMTLALLVVLAGCSAEWDGGEHRVGVAQAKANAIIEESRYDAEAQIEVKRLEADLEKSKAVLDYSLATQAQGMLVAQQRVDTTTATLNNMTIVAVLALIALIVVAVVVGVVITMRPTAQRAALPRPQSVPLLEADADEDDNDLIIGLFATPQQQKLLTKGRRK